MGRLCFVSLSAYGYFADIEGKVGGGAQRQISLLARGLSEEWAVHVVVGDYGQPRDELRDGITFHRAYRPDRSAGTRERVAHLRALNSALARANADVYIARCSPRKLAILYGLLAFRRCQLVYHVPTDGFVSKPPEGVSGLLKHLYVRALQSATVVAQTPRQASLLKENWEIEATVIPNGYPAATVIDRHEQRDHFLWVGRLDREEKQPHRYLDLAESLPEQSFELIGPPERDDDYTARLLDRADRLENVTYRGQVHPDAIHDYYRRAIALVNTSAAGHEGFPNTFLEAWRYATPVISLAVDPGRYLEPGDGHAGCASNDESTLSDIAQRLVNDVAFREQLGIRGHLTFRNNYRIDSIVERYATFLEDIVG